MPGILYIALYDTINHTVASPSDLLDSGATPFILSGSFVYLSLYNNTVCYYLLITFRQRRYGYKGKASTKSRAGEGKLIKISTNPQ
jgi:hypothetical protein